MKFYTRKIDDKYLSALTLLMSGQSKVIDPSLASLYTRKEDAEADMTEGETLVEWDVTETEMFSTPKKLEIPNED